MKNSNPTPAPELKYLGINLTKIVNDLYNKNCKSLKKRVNEDTKI
jgi:hypothetical protein